MMIRQTLSFSDVSCTTLVIRNRDTINPDSCRLMWTILPRCGFIIWSTLLEFVIVFLMKSARLFSCLCYFKAGLLNTTSSFQGSTLYILKIKWTCIPLYMWYDRYINLWNHWDPAASVYLLFKKGNKGIWRSKTTSCCSDIVEWFAQYWHEKGADGLCFQEWIENLFFTYYVYRITMLLIFRSSQLNICAFYKLN